MHMTKIYIKIRVYIYKYVFLVALVPGSLGIIANNPVKLFRLSWYAPKQEEFYFHTAVNIANVRFSLVDYSGKAGKMGNRGEFIEYFVSFTLSIK